MMVKSINILAIFIMSSFVGYIYAPIVEGKYLILYLTTYTENMPQLHTRIMLLCRTNMTLISAEPISYY